MKTYEKVNNYLLEKGIKQKFISEKTGIAENILSAMLNGKRKMYADEFIKIIEVLGVDANFFINSKESN